jgi:(S)-2-hydroxyglutarate dehydrogenase
MRTADFVVIGAGIVGLAIAREIKRRSPQARVIVIEKERAPGLHSSGRNSGVLHSGIYYPPGSLKAKVCRDGCLEWIAWCEERRLPIARVGKLLVPVSVEDAPQLDVLQERGAANGVPVERLDAGELAKREPEARSATGEALFVPMTSVISPAAALASVIDDVRAAGVEIVCGSALSAVDPASRTLECGGERVSYGHAINAAGLHADTVARLFGADGAYTLLPFKGIYWKLDPSSGIRLNHLVYPVPDLRVPFLGVHTTTSIDGTIYLGPTAVPAFGRENYRGLAGVGAADLPRILFLLARQFASGREGFRTLAWKEGPRYFRRWFAHAAQALLPRLRPEHLLACDKVGIRAQMLDRRSGRLVTDFVVEAGPSSTHVINAISPAFTSAFPLARHICDEFIPL